MSTGFDPNSGHVRHVALVYVFSESICFLCQFSILQIFHIHYPSVHPSFNTNSAVKWKVKMCPCVFKHWPMKTYKGLDVFIQQWLCNPLLDLGRFSVSSSYAESVGLLRREMSDVWPLPTENTAQTHNKCTQTSMPRV
jgi:hypothetical protein